MHLLERLRKTPFVSTHNNDTLTSNCTVCWNWTLHAIAQTLTTSEELVLKWMLTTPPSTVVVSPHPAFAPPHPGPDGQEYVCHAISESAWPSNSTWVFEKPTT